MVEKIINNLPKEKELLSVKEVSDILNCSTNYIRKLVEEYKLDAVNIGLHNQKLMIIKSSLILFLKKNIINKGDL